MAKQQVKVKEINAAILARVSTQGQKDNSSLEGQVNTCRAYCDQMGYTIGAERREVMSGSFVLARSGLAELLDMAADGLIQVIVVDVPDRLGRGDAIAKIEYMTELNGARVEYVRGAHDKSTLEGIVQDSNGKMLSGIERFTIRRRMMDGVKNRIAEGRIIAPPRRPYGYRIVNECDQRGRKTSCTFEIVESEARIVRDIYEWCVYEAMTSSAIVTRLNKRQIPRMCDTDADTQRIRLALTTDKTLFDGWGRSQVVHILRSTLYQGQWQYTKTKSQHIDTPGKVKHKITQKGADDESILTVAVPAIVMPDLWNAAQEQLDENKRKFMYPPINDYVLRGRIRCALCGKAMVGQTIKYHSTKGELRIYRYYACTNVRAASNLKARRCHAKGPRADFVEAAVWNSIRDAMQEPDRLWVCVRKSNEANKKARRLLEQATAAEQAEIDKIQAKETRLLDLYESGDITKATYRARIAENKAAIDKPTGEKAKIMARMGECAILTPEQEETLQHFQREIAARMTDDVLAVDRMQLYDILRVECVYNADKKELLISGLFGDAIVLDMRKSSS
jgi:site-specific DNA recombinase